MVEVILNLGTLEQGTISETDRESSADDQVRSDNYVTNDYSFFKCISDIRAAVLKPVEGSMEGIPKSSPSTYDAVPGVPSNYTVITSDYNNPNYKIEYYWWHSGTGNNYKRGCVALRLPIYNYTGDKPKARGFRDISSSSYANFNIDYDSIDVLGNTITYTSNGETITKSITQLLSASSDDYYAELRGVRDSKDEPCEVAYLGYDSNNNVKFSKRWEESRDDNIIDFTDGLAITKWKFVLRVENVSTLKTGHILNDHKKIKLQMDAWEMTQDNVLINSGMCEGIDSEILVYPFPASFWELDSSNKLETFMLPEEISGDILTYPFPKSFWELDDNNKLEMFMLPEYLPVGAFALTTELQEIRLPESLEEIGPEAFYGSAIRRVTIPNNQCTYYATSFPPGCVVTGGHLIE